MKVVAKDVEMVVWFGKEITPIKFRYEDTNGKYITIKVDKVISRTQERYCGNLAWIFDCQSLIGDEMRQYQIKFFISECRWVLFKI